jgi:hypothetical protein
MQSSSQDLISKKTHHKKKAGDVAQGVGSEFQPWYCKNKNKNKKNKNSVCREKLLTRDILISKEA